MQNIDIIQKSLDYIEENLKAEFHVSELADAAGYSLFHYYRIFQKLVGIPVMQYITRRKLLHAAFEISKGIKIIDAAYAYGFETKAGFYKAFVHEFHCSPSEYITRHAAKRPYRINLIQEEHIMLSHKKIKEMLTYWNMQNETVTDFYYAGSGVRADSQWNVGDSYILKAGTNIAGLEKHIKITNALANQGFNISLPVKTVEEKDYYWDGELYYCLENKLTGEPVESSSLYETGNDFTPRYLGEIIGQMDLLLAKFDNDFICNEPNILGKVQNCIPKIKEIASLPKNFFDDYIAGFSAIYDNLPKQLIHRNPCPNCFVNANSSIGITDFELSERNLRIFDPCYTATAVLSENFDRSTQEPEKWFAIFQNIIAGYDSVAKLSREEKEAIPYVIFAIQFICVNYFSSREKYKELAEINLRMLEWLVENKEHLRIA